MRPNPKNFARTMGKEKLCFCCDAKLADCTLRAAGQYSTPPQREAKHKANTEKGSTERRGPNDIIRTLDIAVPEVGITPNFSNN